LPLIQYHAQRAAKRLPPRLREEFRAEVAANAFAAFARLVERGLEGVIYATPLAKYAVRHVRAGRVSGGSRNSKDVMSAHAQHRRGFSVARLDPHDVKWEESLLDDRRTPVADQAAFRIDFPAWLATLDAKRQRIAESLAVGDATQSVERQLGLSPGRISQIRQELCAAWQRFHDPSQCMALAPAAKRMRHRS